MDNKVGIYFAYWEKDWDADFAYYIKRPRIWDSTSWSCRR